MDSDFWHGKNFRELKPRLKNDFWVRKIERNMARDKKVNKLLKKKGWNVLRLGETEMRRNSKELVAWIERELRNR